MLNCTVLNRTVYMYKIDLALNNLKWLICHKTKPKKIFSSLLSIYGIHVFKIAIFENVFHFLVFIFPLNPINMHCKFVENRQINSF